MLDKAINAIILSDWAALLLVGAILLGTAEIGFRMGRRLDPAKRAANESQSGKIQGALLGLLGLLMGFTFAMSVARYETRKQLVLDEANAIGTAWLRAGMLGDTARDASRPALIDYVDARIKGASVLSFTKEFQAQVARSEQDQVKLWHAAVAAVKDHDSPATSLYVAALNDLIDLDAKRLAAMRNHVPGTVWLLLTLVSVTACWTVGYTTGLGGSARHALPMIVLPVLLAVVITIIADLDNPKRGLIVVSQQSMIDLHNTLAKYRE